ncbi:hypothetical protein O6H91_05G082200 [Diphasiastrum complanatum]|uniref:Uncharacterized protein n=1 Tax=Diphasiastrum complanatum TaxID=34168 RepID=A0ACC2DQE4_DIPCM|nr:hypothetical protein O6H91_05G082200 [Diphasiastrum complanatum]
MAALVTSVGGDKMSAQQLATSLLRMNLKEWEAWEYNANNEDHRVTHKFSPNRPVPQEHIHEPGVLTWKLDVDEWEKNTLLETIKMDRGYKYSEVVTVCHKEMEDFEEKVKGFFQEHMHSQEEIRLILDGNGYWDIRDYDGKWIRFRVTKGDMIVLPPGMFHKFTLDENHYIKVTQPYVSYRTQHGAESESAARKEYVDKVLNNPAVVYRRQITPQ